MAQPAGRILFCATVARHLERFHQPVMRWFKSRGWEVHAAASGTPELPWTDRQFDVPFSRSPLKPVNIAAYRQLRRIIAEGGYQLIHCHTPTAGVLTRLAARGARRSGVRVLYTAHGFHFQSGGPKLNWLLFYPVERMLARLTDCLITINEEDFRLAADRRFPAGRIVRVHGVGIDLERFRPADAERRRGMRRLLGYGMEDQLLFYAAEFNRNKNQRMLIEALALLKDDFPRARLLLAGDGPLRPACEELAARLGVRDRVDFLGYRPDIADWLPALDIAVASSFREGLPVNVLEAMACGLPVVATSNRGHRELVRPGRNGWLVPPGDARQMAGRIRDLLANPRERAAFGAAGRAIASSSYGLDTVMAELRAVYASILGEMEIGKWQRQFGYSTPSST
ncbi:MAG: glycosyl transferase [Thermobacillus sp. ZCTH02-B1]|uniref:glycosyltransferase family 4 protein n=1 Tax=Thermobacillus sp. ZCTH02-B1 TaxID=1858795 RepID=UPI000B5823E2|nr:glycosyltransferase family 4 protein [Thermobacillus sp. ZCTH02-B1]OUM95715.1 MAG: glycosyl transferase [Thermobacillus sp. ZCTH02-B1]